jgi:hypothetical protein
MTTDAYRTSGYQCPVCTNATLREFDHRLVCDECNGMLIDGADFARSLHELDGGTDPLVASDDKPNTKTCPRCSGPTTSCTIAIGWLKLTERLMHCEKHGLWMPRDAMTAMYARASRRAHGNSGLNRTYGGAGGGPPPLAFSGTYNSAINSIQGAFGSGPATAGLAIGNWHLSRPQVHTLFVSAHKDRTLGCPSCKDTKLEFNGDRWTCATCAGCFVEDAALAAMVMEMTNQPWVVPEVKGGPGDRNCPVCETAMIVEVLEAVTIDRCPPHGVWFDDTELQAALHHASAEPTGLGGWIKQLFLREK